MTYLRVPVLALVLACACRCPSDVADGPTPDPAAGGAAAAGPNTTGELLVRPAVDPAVRAAELAARRLARDQRWAALANKHEKATAQALWSRADKQEKAQNWKDAEDALVAFAVHHGGEPRAAQAAQRAMLMAFRRGEYGEGFTFAEDFLLGLDDKLVRARFSRVLGNAFLAAPHWGTQRGGEVLRARSDQGKQVQTHREDRARAVELLEEARALFADVDTGSAGAPRPPGSDDKLRAERIEAQLDLATAVARFTWFDSTWHYWWYAWGERADDGLADAEGEDERVDEDRYWGGWWGAELQRAQPRGLEVTPQGDVVFVKTPAAYAPELDDTAKIKFLLSEAETLDASVNKDLAAGALMLRALLFRTRDGSERLDRLASWWWQGANPYKSDIEGKALHTLGDDEVLGLIATHVGVYRVPEDESVPGLLARIAGSYPNSDRATEALLQLGYFHQSREQYARALEVFRRLPASSPHAGSAQSAIRLIEQQEAGFVETGVQAAGKKARLKVKSRNIDGVTVRATRVDLEGALAAFQRAWREGGGRNDDGYQLAPDNLMYQLLNDDKRAATFLTGDRVEFSAPLVRDAEHRYGTQEIETTIDRPGLWLLEGYARGDDKTRLARGLVLLEEMALVHKRTSTGPITWVVDARTGAPIAGVDVEAFNYWSDYVKGRETRHSRRETVKTDARGVARHGYLDHQLLITARKDGRVAHPSQQWFGGRYSPSSSDENARRAVLMTDRPVYRPGDTVKAKVWARERRDGRWLPAQETKSLWVRVADPRGQEVLAQTLGAEQWGSASFELPLKIGAPLGAWSVQVQVDGAWCELENASFQVEEYKAPELTVTVGAAGQARLGDKVPFEVRADYLFGGGVAGAKAHYKVFRQDHEHTYTAPGAWDWLYGRGYGRVYYAYRWFPWWGEHGPHPWIWYPWWGPPPEPAKELVLEGEGRLDEHGRLKVELDTSRAARDYGRTDHRYTIVAEVTDASRRLVKGEGEVIVTRNAFLASVETDGGWANAGQQVAVVVSTSLPDGSPFPTKGKLVVEEVAFAADNGMVATESKVETLPVATDAHGPTRISWRAPRTGQFKLSFVATDAWGKEVVASTVVWVAGPGFKGRAYRMNGLELIADKRTYTPGEVAHVLVNVDSPGASVLLATKVDHDTVVDWSVVEVPDKSRVIDIPITAAHAPNFFIEATTVRDAELFQEARELFVPPQHSELVLAVEGAKSEYQPGEQAELVIVAKDGAGQPVVADVALSVFDSAVLYIKPDAMPDVRAVFWGKKRTHAVTSTSNLQRRFDWYLGFVDPHRWAASMLAAAATRHFQGAVNFRSGDLEGALSGADALAVTDSSVSGTLGFGGLGGGGGGRGKLATAEAPAPSARAAEAQPQREEAKKEASEADDRRRDDGRFADEKNASKLDGHESEGGFTPSVRRAFADTALWVPRVITGTDGRAKVTVKFPDNLTTWKLKAVGMSADSRAGQVSTSLVTTKKLLVRLQAPRFFRERDRVLLSAIVHNRHTTAKATTVTLEVDEALLAPEGKLAQQVKVAPGGEARVDFWVTARGEGPARVKMTARASDDGDAKELTFPVLVHGFDKMVSSVGSILPSASSGGVAEKNVALEIPQERRADSSRLVVRWSPSLAGGMIDALPYLLDYPYGCVEQTLSRFVPAVLTRKALQQSGGVKLEELARARTNLNAQQLTDGGKADQERVAREHKQWDRNPIYDTALLDDIVANGLARVKKMQHADGGWGWWADDDSSVYMTAYVVAALLDAHGADLAIDTAMLARGQAALATLVESDLLEYRRSGGDWVSDSDAYFAWVMARSGQKNAELDKYLWQRRIHLSAYGKLLAAMAFHLKGDKPKATTLLQNAEQTLKNDDENETSWIDTRADGWWYWWNDDIETNAAYLRALDTMRPKDERSGRVVKWLLNHRKHGWYWDSTRDTAQVIAAFANHMQVSGERRPDYDLEVLWDGVPKKTVHIDSSNLFTYDGELVLDDDELAGGKHTLTLRRKGEGAVYFNSYLSFFTQEEDVKATGLEVKVARTYHKLVREDRQDTAHGDLGQRVGTTELAYRRVPLASGAQLVSGDLVEVELMLESKNDYTFLAFEDPKPAGLEAVALRSGRSYGEAVANLELRDDRVVFFLSELTQGKLKLSYRLRAEIPGEFHAMPTVGFGMYAPEIRANSDEMRVKVVDAP